MAIESVSEKSGKVVITGIGIHCPLGNSATQLLDALTHERSGIAELTSIPSSVLPSPFGAEARCFTGSIEDFGPLEKMLARKAFIIAEAAIEQMLGKVEADL